MSEHNAIRKEQLSAPFLYKTMEAIEQSRPSQKEQAHRHDYYTVIFTKAAAGIHHIDFKHYPLEANTFYLVSPEQVHHMELWQQPQGQVLLFTTDFLQRHCMHPDQFTKLELFFNCDEAPPIHIAEEELPAIQQLLKAIAKETADQEWQYLSAVGAFLKVLLLRLGRIRRATSPDQLPFQSRKAIIVQQFKKDLEAQFRAEHKASHYAELQHLSPNYLNEVIKGETGRSVKDFIQGRILLEAKRLALYSDHSMKEIAYQLGFEDTAHFSKLFKKAEGINFSAFRQNLQNANF